MARRITELMIMLAVSTIVLFVMMLHMDKTTSEYYKKNMLLQNTGTCIESTMEFLSAEEGYAVFKADSGEQMIFKIPQEIAKNLKVNASYTIKYKDHSSMVSIIENK